MQNFHSTSSMGEIEWDTEFEIYFIYLQILEKKEDYTTLVPGSIYSCSIISILLARKRTFFNPFFIIWISKTRFFQKIRLNGVNLAFFKIHQSVLRSAKQKNPQNSSQIFVGHGNTNLLGQTWGAVLIVPTSPCTPCLDSAWLAFSSWLVAF